MRFYLVLAIFVLAGLAIFRLHGAASARIADTALPQIHADGVHSARNATKFEKSTSDKTDSPSGRALKLKDKGIKKTHIVRSGDTLGLTLRNFKLPAETQTQVLSALKKHMDIRKITPGQEIIAMTRPVPSGAVNHLIELQIRPNSLQTYETRAPRIGSAFVGNHYRNAPHAYCPKARRGANQRERRRKLDPE